jgi:hypothetical protein
MAGAGHFEARKVGHRQNHCFSTFFRQDKTTNIWVTCLTVSTDMERITTKRYVQRTTRSGGTVAILSSHHSILTTCAEILRKYVGT